MESAKVKFSEETEQGIKALMAVSDNPSASLMGVLHVVRKQFGFISGDVEEAVAARVGRSVAFVHGVVSFYTMYNQKPVGKYLLQFCSTLPCALRGSEELFDHCAKKLGIRNGETTKDNKFTLMKVECLGSCGTAPVVQINDDYHENLDAAKLDKLLDSLE